MEEKIKILQRLLGEERIKTSVDISEFLHTKLGAICKGFYIATNSRELIKVIELCRELKVPYLIFGSGSKIALSTDGFEGVAIKNRSDNLKISGIKGKVSREGIGVEEALVEADSGVSLKRLAEFTSEQNLSGLEGVRSMIGTVGGSLSINSILRDRVHQVEILTSNSQKKIKTLNQLVREDTIIRVVFKLKAKKLI